MKTIIPSTLLKYPKLNYVKVSDDGKKCFELRWNKKIYRFDNLSLKYHLEHGRNYGIQTNNSFIEINGIERQLVIIDFDNRELQDKVLNEFPQTLTTTSGSPKKCLHLWLATDKQTKKLAIKDKNENTLADVLGEHGQIVCPNSKHPSGSIYKIVNDEPIAYVPYDKILEILMPYQQAKPKPIKEQKNYSHNSFWDEVKSRINVIDILNDEGINTKKSPTQCPFNHASEKGECFTFNEECWHCWNCERRGNIFTLIKELKNLSDKETFEWFSVKLGLEEELKQHQIEYMKGRT